MKWNVALAIVLVLFLLGCETGPTMIECTPPLLLHGDSCCMDADRNGVCDIQEAKPAVEKTEEPEAELPSETEKQMETTPAEEQPVEEAALQPAQDPETVAKLFAERWQEKDYNMMYTLFTPYLKGKKSVDEFKAIMELDPLYKKVREVNFKGLEQVNSTRYRLLMSIRTNIQDIELTDTELRLREGGWKVRAFADVFELDLFDAACSGYKQNNQYKTSDCAFDLAKKVNDHQYCSKSECHYVECLKALGKPGGMTQEAEQCRMCQPAMKTTNDCILDVAIKYDKVSACDVISENHYSDKYCFCYGGFAKHKGTSGYCNMITEPDYKDLCLKGYEGGYC